MILELDIGNSRIKWRLLNEEARLRDAGALACDEFEPWLQSSGSEWSLSAIYVASVGDQEKLDKYSALFSTVCGVDAQFAVSQATTGKLRCAYDKPETLGVDRWLAMLGAYADGGQAVCVIDCGTACTIDFVSADGQHFGGYILPGLEMIRKSLLAGTSRIESAYDRLSSTGGILAGVSTSEAIEHGRLMMTVAAIEKAIAINQANDFNVYVTGGDAGAVLEYLPAIMNAVLWPDLVLDGLGVMFGYRSA